VRVKIFSFSILLRLFCSECPYFRSSSPDSTKLHVFSLLTSPFWEGFYFSPVFCPSPAFSSVNVLCKTRRDRLVRHSLGFLTATFCHPPPDLISLLNYRSVVFYLSSSPSFCLLISFNLPGMGLFPALFSTLLFYVSVGAIQDFSLTYSPHPLVWTSLVLCPFAEGRSLPFLPLFPGSGEYARRAILFLIVFGPSAAVYPHPPCIAISTKPPLLLRLLLNLTCIIAGLTFYSAQTIPQKPPLSSDNTIFLYDI